MEGKKKSSILGRPKAYQTPAALKRAAEKYLLSISREVVVKEPVDTGRKDSYGHVIFEWIPVKNDAGEEIKRREFVVVPTITGLRMALGISKQTWSNYGKREGYAAVIERVVDVLRGWRDEQLVTRTKGVRGIEADLELNYGCRKKAEVDVNHRLSEGQGVAELTDAELWDIVTRGEDSEE